MRKLIDANKLLKIIENDIQMTQSWLEGCKSVGEKVSLTVQLNTIKSYQAIVEDLPTAFDVDKVVEQLESLEPFHVDGYGDVMVNCDDVIEIVKRS